MPKQENLGDNESKEVLSHEESLSQMLKELKEEGPADFKKAVAEAKEHFEERMSESKDKPKSEKRMLILECSGMNNLLGHLTVLADQRLDSSNTEMVDATKIEKFPESFDDVGGIVITGSPSDIVEKGQKPWIGQTESFVKQALDRNIPVMGICFGIQLHADLKGRQVPSNEGGREMGIWKTSIYMENEPIHPIFKDIPFQESPDGKARSAVIETIGSHAYHVEDDVINRGEKLYGYHFTQSGHGYPMIEIDGSFIGTQFHPELSTPEGLKVIESLVKNRSDKLVADGKDPKEILDELKIYKEKIKNETPVNGKFLENFVSIVFNKEK